MKSLSLLRTALLPLLLGLPLLAAGCSGDDDDDQTQPGGTATPDGGDDDSGDDDTGGDDDSGDDDGGDDDSSAATPSGTPGDTPGVATPSPAEDYPYAKTLFVRGTFNSWSNDPSVLEPYTMQVVGENLLRADVELPFGNVEFKVADDAWSAGTNFGNPPGTNDQLTPGVAKQLADNGFNLKLAVDTAGVYSISLDTTARLTPSVTVEFLYPVEQTCAPDLTVAKAHWLNADTLAWYVQDAASYILYYAPEGGIDLEESVLSGGTALSLTAIGTLESGDPLLAEYPYLSGYTKFDTSSIAAQIPELLQGQLVVVSFDAKAAMCDATQVQTAGVIDDLYTYSGSDLGVSFGEDGSPTLKLWAPTARAVTLSVYEHSDAQDAPPPETVAMTRGDDGVWTATGTSDWVGREYTYSVEVYVRATDQVETNVVTDPWSVSLTMNSARSQIIDIEDPSLKPDGWESLAKPALDAFEDIVVYELHVRDFSVNDPSCPEEARGRYTAFAAESDGMTHLRELAEAGLTHLHLQPTFDIATVNEDSSQHLTPDIPVDAGPDSTEQQAAVSAVKGQDAFNWGYDPLHYRVPEGSYATDPDGAARILEFRQMVQGLSGAGLRVVLDQVYNHTNAAGQNDYSVLDRIVPGYFYRLDSNGNVQSSTCCPDTASENAMMEKLVIDSVLTWAVQYKVDGFRFDLMGHHTLANMQHVREALDALTLEQHGVDGTKIYLYGEGWRFGSLNDILPEQAFHQANSYGYGIGTFNDRIRDSVRGGSPFAPLWEQGFVTGMYYDDNYLDWDGAESIEDYLEAQRASLLNLADNIRIGMTGNLRDYAFVNAEGQLVTGAEIVYRGSSGSGYTADPQESINYASVHDNQTLFDYIQAKAPFEVDGRTPATATLEERVRMQNLANSIILLGQGVPFFLAGDDLLRSKSGDKDSYDSGDWFNRIDFSYQANNWGVGLPIADKNEGDWDFWDDRLVDPSLMPGGDHIDMSLEHFREMLRIRKSSVLFRLRNAGDVMARVSFLETEAGAEQTPGLIVMAISDEVEALADLDPERERIVSLFNATTEEILFSHETLAVPLVLHPVQQVSVDSVVSSASCGTGDGSIQVPPRTALVCVLEE